ncbi:MAG: hypothetical protein R3257_03960 [bacterium]|nr:hypothetical protein [bacterium]
MKILKKLKKLTLSIPFLFLPSAALAGFSSGHGSGAEGSWGLFGLVFFGTLLGILTMGRSEAKEAPQTLPPSFR